MSQDRDRDQVIADLREQVAALEEIVRRRSDQLRSIQSQVCAKDRLMIASVLDGESILEFQLASIEDYYSMDWFNETTTFLPSSVEKALDDAWQHGPARMVESGDTP